MTARLAWLLLGATILVQICFPLTSGGTPALTTAAVLLFASAMLVDAATSRGVGAAAVLLVVAGGGGLLAEAIGVHTGFPFGEYDYTGTLGLEIAGVPILVPLAWIMMAWPAWNVARRLVGRHGPVATVAVGAWALTAWDVFLDPQMVDAGHWYWLHTTPNLPGVEGIPLTNFGGWLLVSALMMTVLEAAIGRSDSVPTLHTDAVPVAAYLWTYFSSVLAHAVFFGRAPVALTGALVMGVVAVPLAVSVVRESRTARRSEVTVSTLRDHRLAHRLWCNLIRIGAVNALGGLALTVDNARRIRVPDATLPCEPEPLWVLLPVRDEAADITDCVRSLQSAAARWPGPSRVVVLDDESTDATPDLLAQLSADDDGLVVLRGQPRPEGWLGKPWACAQLAAFAADDTAPDRAVLVFVDADVRLATDALVATVATMRAAHLDLFCPYPLQETSGAAERLVQPLLQWSWMSTLPLRLAERSPRPSLSAANGQFLAVDKDAYERAGGHRAVRADVLEDIGLLRAVKASGGCGVVGEGSTVVSCRMYDGWSQVRAGYRKSLWAAFGSPAGAVAVMTFLIVSYVVPAVAALGGSRLGVVGYLAGVASRVVTARRTGGHAWPDALLHPVSVLALATLTADSIVGRRRGALRWKGRPVQA